MKDQLLSKLNAYSALATSVLFIPVIAEAQIVYTNPPDVALNSDLLNEQYLIDLNSDGFNDYEVFATDYFGNHIWVGQNYLNPWELGLYENCNTNFLMAFALSPGQQITPNNPHWVHDTGGGNYFNVCATFTGTCLSHRWGGKQNRFLGVRIPVPGSTNHFYYGWIRLTVGPECKGVVIKDWAYNSNPDHPIFAGQMMSPLKEEDPPTIIGDETTDVNVFANGHNIIIENNSRENDLESKLKAEVFNTTGQMVIATPISGTHNLIDMQNFSSGLYIVRITGGNIFQSSKVFLK